MQNIRMVALDLDGTVFNDQKQITPRTLQAIRTALDKGVVVLPATGRTLTGVPEAFSAMPGVRYALTSNGAAVYDLQTGEQFVYLPLQADLALALYDLVAPFGGSICVFVAGKAYVSEQENEQVLATVDTALVPYLKASRSFVPDLRAFLAAHADCVEKFSLMYADEATRDAVWQAVQTAYPDVEAATSIPRNLELNAPGVTKGRGLMALAEKLHLVRAQVMACGDSGNDRAMIEAAGLGVAMGNATEDIKAVADYVTADNNHDGVAEAIEKFVL